MKHLQEDTATNLDEMLQPTFLSKAEEEREYAQLTRKAAKIVAAQEGRVTRRGVEQSNATTQK